MSRTSFGVPKGQGETLFCLCNTEGQRLDRPIPPHLLAPGKPLLHRPADLVDLARAFLTMVVVGQ